MSRLKVSIGLVEIEYEGEQGFIESGLSEFAERLIKVAAQNPAALASKSTAVVPLPSIGSGGALPASTQHLSTTTIAQALEAKTGGDLAFAAAAHLILVQEKSTASRADILECMKSASIFYKDTYSGNLSASLDNLVKGKRLNQVGKNLYAIAAAEMKNLGVILAKA